jgi:hypothetical protein
VEIFYITSGQGQFLVEDQSYPVSANQLVVINPHILHTEESLNAQPLEYIVLGIEGIELMTDENGSGPFIILDHFEGVEVSGCLRNILREMEQKNTGYEDVCQAYMEILMIRLMRSISLSVSVEPQAVSGNRQCDVVRRYIDHHFKEPLTLEQLAEKGHMNKYYLAHAF